MSELLNRGGTIDYGNLIYDGSHDTDAKNIAITVNGGETKDEGVLNAGQVIDIDANGQFVVHATGGTPAYILAEDAEYASDDTAVTATVYISGTFRASKLIASPALTDADKVALQEKGIFLK